METKPALDSRLRSFIARLDKAVAGGASERVVSEVKTVLEAQQDLAGLLPPRFLVPAEDGCYARRLLHRDPSGRYSVVVMTWGPGQSTPLHDHCGMWCVECVEVGRIVVTQYDLAGEPDGELFRFRRRNEIIAGVGEAGALIPPYEYHTIANPFEEKAITVHVYGGEMTRCSVFLPEGDRYRRQEKVLCYTK